MGRRVEQVPENYVLANFREWNDRSRAATSASTVSTSCSCTARRRRSTARDEVFDALDTMVDEGRIANYGVSVETRRRGADRHRPPERRQRADHPQRVPAEAARAGAARRPPKPASASSPACRWRPACCRAATPTTPPSPPTTTATTTGDGEAFDVGETFAGVDFATGVEAAREFAALAPDGVTPAAARPALDHRSARCHLRDPRRAQRRPGAGQRAAADLAPLDAETLPDHRPVRPAHPPARPRQVVSVAGVRRQPTVPDSAP